VIREDKGALADAVRRLAQGSGGAGDVAVRLRSAPEDPVSLSLAGVRGLGEGAVILSLKDSSEETRLKREIAQATKMQAVGQLAGGVAHDFNNVLTAIIGYCDLMLMRHTPGDSDYDDIQQIRANSNRAASLTRQLLAFSRQQTLRPEVLQLPDVVAEISTLLKRLLGEKIQLEVTHDRGLGLVRADPVQLEQVLLNLAVNARDAMAGIGASGGIPSAKSGGVLRLKTKRVTAADVRSMKSEILPIGDYTALIVEDTGQGIPPAQIGKIFEPFFTTKEKGKGTGLGLSTVYGIVKQSGGFIFAESEVGKGTRFTIYLPVHVPDAADVAEAAAAATAARLPAPRKQWSGGGRVLLVEDEDTVRAVAERALSRQGYEVTTASDGEDGLEALGRAIAAGEEFDLVLSDVVMPSMDGPAMAREIRNLRPDLPVLFMSGYAEEQLRREIDIPNMYFLAKPFSVTQICTAVEDVLKAR
jgi:two-component system cell cycle sensor histidine kinase/response regulator CckA